MSELFNPYVDMLMFKTEKPCKWKAKQYENKRDGKKIDKRRDGYQENKGGGRFICGKLTALSVSIGLLSE